MDQPKIERLLRLMKLLTANTRYSVDELAERLGMSRRTVYRYIDTFREAGFVIKRSGDYVRLDKESPHFKDISQLVHFTDEEAVIIRQSIESIDDTNVLKSELRCKLLSIYDNGVIASRVDTSHSRNIHALSEAISSHQRVVLKGYKSAHGRVVRDRVVEPFAFTAGYVQVWCYDTEDGVNKLFKSSRIGGVEIVGEWQCKQQHHEGFIDIFRMNSDSTTMVTLELGMLSYSLLIEEYPLAENFVTQIDSSHWRLSVEVANFVGVGRFVIGLIDDVVIVEPAEFKEYIHDYAKKML